MIEVEIKVGILNPDQIRKKFLENNGTYKLSLHHEDTYFNMPSGLRDFKQTDEALRLRKSIRFDKNNKLKSQETEYFITYKGKKIDLLTKTRKEIDIRIESVNQMKDMLKMLGFQEVLIVKKERELYEFLFKNLRIEALIDYIPILKRHFVEVEYLCETNEKVNDFREILFDFLSTFNINRDESIRKSYLELIFERLEI
ncbi:MAG: class IV adenylate cyclase [Promethearchaeota archaeon]|jgi:adenylate cyclase class 2